MKRQLIDYSGFSLRRLNEPQFRHLKLLAGWIFYFAMYFLTENLIAPESCHSMHCALDDKIPFNEYFVIFYVGWYFLVAGSLLYTMLTDVKNFSRLQTYIIITQVFAMAIYIMWPSRQDLRPEVFPRENIFTALVAFIYSFDTNTGVCPSLHVAYSMGILSTAYRDREFPLWAKVLLTVFVILICCSVCFIKQHSFLDVVGVIPFCLMAEILTFHVLFPDEKAEE